ncbi:MAG: FAD-dependent oxidoreductase, partial [Muribaculaceae bacterium]|nr:FAD-dependent oxidoreductase [Muribaculaceae bacterium]
EILPPFDKDIAKRLRQTLGKRGIKIVPQAGVKAIAPCDEGLTVTYDLKGKEQSLVAERVLMSVGRQPVLPEGLDTIGVTVGRRGIEVNDQMQTNVEGVYAIGDVNGRMMLAHAASAQGEVALASILGKPCDIRLDIVPSAVFTVPELSMVGLTEEQCAERGMEVVVKKAFFRSNGKAVSMAEPDGLIKMIVDAQTRQIVGCHIMGAHAADLIQEVVMAMNADVPVDRLAHSIHGHPTLTEVVMTAARQF